MIWRPPGLSPGSLSTVPALVRVAPPAMFSVAELALHQLPPTSVRVMVPWLVRLVALTVVAVAQSAVICKLSPAGMSPERLSLARARTVLIVPPCWLSVLDVQQERERAGQGGALPGVERGAEAR